MPNLFDDLIPQQQQAPPADQPPAVGGNLFDDLIPKQEPYSGTILPFSSDAQGNVSFDSNAGVLGMAKSLFGAAKSAATLPGDVFTGKVDPRSDEAIRRAAEFSAFASPLNPGIRAGDMAIPGVAKALRRPEVAPPTAQALKDAGGAGLNEVRDMGVDYSAAAVQDVARALRSELERDGLRAETAPTTFSLLSKFDNPPEGAFASVADIMAARRSFGEAAKNFSNPTEQLAAKRVIEGLDRFIEEPGPGAVLAGPAEGVSAALKRSNANYAAGKRSDKITGVAEKAERRAEASNSGHNIDNTIRQRIASVLEKPKERAGFNQAEIDALESLVRGTRGRNTLRNVGNLLGGGGGLGQALTGAGGAVIGGSIGGGPGAGIGALLAAGTGASAKALANALTKRGAGNIDKMTRMRSPLYEDMLASMPLEAITPDKRAALVRALLLSQGDN